MMDACLLGYSGFSSVQSDTDKFELLEIKISPWLQRNKQTPKQPNVFLSKFKHSLISEHILVLGHKSGYLNLYPEYGGLAMVDSEYYYGRCSKQPAL